MAKSVNKKAVEVIEDPKVNEVLDVISTEGKKPRPAGNWIKMDEDALALHQANGDLLGWDPVTGEGLLKKK